MAEADPQKTFEVSEPGNDLSKLLDRGNAGEVVLTKAGVPIAKLVPYPQPAAAPRVPGGYKDLLKGISAEDIFAPCFTDEELDRIYNEDIDPARR